MTLLVTQDIVEAGINATYAAANVAGDTVKNDGRLMLHVKNGHTAAQTVTVAAQKPTATRPGFGTVSKANVVVSVPATSDRFIGPFPLEAFNDGSALIAITYSAVTLLTVATLRLPAVS